MSTQLNVFVIIGETGSLITKKMIEDFSAACMKYALKNNKGWPRGLQSGVGSIAILKGPGVDQDAIHFCEHPSKKHWSAFELPVIYDTSARRAVRYKTKPVWGVIYFPFFTKTIDGITSKL